MLRIRNVCLPALLLVSAPLCLSQDAGQRLQVHGFGSARSEGIRVKARQLLAIRTSQKGELVPAIFISDEAENLLAKNNEAGDTSNFDWRAPGAGRYRVTIFSNSETEVEYTIRVLKGDDLAPPANRPTFAVVPVFWATNRNVASRRPPHFDTELSKDGSLSYGVSEVSVPMDHVRGQLESPSILRLEFRPDPEKHVVLLASELSEASRFFSDVSRYTMRSTTRDALVFIPGFASTLEEASRRTAQISFDLKFKGPSILFSWPSQGEPGDRNYLKDSHNAEHSMQQLRSFLVDLARNSKIDRIEVIVQGLGNIPLVNALAGVPSETSHVDRVALLAPNMDAATFRKLAADFRKAANSISLYASSNDSEMVTSKRLEGYPRAGQSRPDVVVVPGIDTIDAFPIDISILGTSHASHEDKFQILADLFGFLTGNTPDRRIALRQAHIAAGTYWVFSPTGR